MSILIIHVSAGSNYANFVPFEVSKGDSLSVGEGGTVSVSVPRDLRGRSEIVVFLSQEPVRGKLLPV